LQCAKCAGSTLPVCYSRLEMRKFITSRYVWITVSVLFIGCASVWAGSVLIVKHASEGKTYSDMNALPHRHVGLVLGCSPRLGRNMANPFFQNRIHSAVELFRAGKVDVLLVSGDNHHQGYDEPTEMRNALLDAGVPAEKIVLDYAGFRTLDSMVRAKEVFGQSEVTVISQEFHNRRAIFIAQHHGLDAVGYNSPDVYAPGSVMTHVREQAAKVKTVLDIYLLKTKPHFLGDKVLIGAMIAG